MKPNIYRILYSVVSFLADKTNGFKPLVRYKLALGTLILGLAACDSNPKSGKVARSEFDYKWQGRFYEATLMKLNVTSVFCYFVPPDIEENNTEPNSSTKVSPFVADSINKDEDLQMQTSVFCYIVIGEDTSKKEIDEELRKSLE